MSARGGLAVFLDAQGQVLDSCWVDRRAAGCARVLADVIGDDLDYQTRGLASKTFLLRRNAPERFDRLRYPLFARDFIQYRLTNTIATDPSSGPPNGVWPRRLWDAVGFPVERLAMIRPHTELAGALTPAAATRLGLPHGIPVGIGGHDGACANAGAGAIRPGQVCLTLGTQGVARAALEGVTFAFRSVVEREREIGLAVDDIRLSGGGARNPLWVQIMSDVLGAPMTVVEADEGGRGAAMFLSVGLGWYRSPEDVAGEWVRPVRRVEPTSRSAIYERVYRRYCSLADAVYAADVE